MRAGVVMLLVAVLTLLTLAVPGTASTAAVRCGPRALVLAAMPLELNPLLSRALIDTARTVRVGDRTFYEGRLGGTSVVLGMTGIGMVNATETATAAFDHFRCPFTAAIFSGVAGSKEFIGDVTIPERWTRDGAVEGPWLQADPAMVQAARSYFAARRLRLAQDVPVGDAACLCPGVDAATPVHLEHEPRVLVGGDGTSGDTFGDRKLPCVPGGGDVFGCAPCLATIGTADDIAGFAANAPSLADPGFITGFFQPPEETTSTMAAQDMETYAFGEAAARYGVPFLGIRAVSDGQGDPLGLPGFPAQFFAYRQLAGNNAAEVTIAFLRTWAARGFPTAG